MVKDASGKHVSDFISADTSISSTGEVRGTLKYVSEVSGFHGDESNGYFFPLTLDSKYRGKEITVKRVGSRSTKATDLEWLLYVPDKQAKFTFETVSDGVFLTVTFTKVTLGEKPTIGALTVVSAEGEGEGKTKLTVTPEKGGSNVYLYKTNESSDTTVTYDEDVSSWTSWDGSAEIEATTGHHITVVEATSGKRARKSGSAEVKSKASEAA